MLWCIKQEKLLSHSDEINPNYVIFEEKCSFCKK